LGPKLINHLSDVLTVTHNGVANLYVARAHFSAPIKSLAQNVSVDVLDRKGRTPPFHSTVGFISCGACTTIKLRCL
ncbi:MAG TPA: hypothetical protein VFO40_24570, partial [Chthoniobacterales bacterium]|nr:hypothetical protein [Chthoniobacterales bacterium]